MSQNQFYVWHSLHCVIRIIYEKAIFVFAKSKILECHCPFNTVRCSTRIFLLGNSLNLKYVSHTIRISESLDVVYWISHFVRCFLQKVNLK